ncbi:MAG TPA: LmbU family transcriptional regulator [Streptosporangiaceae bacterium]|nr:LmbU family transcriptional regulator [Streptosporangiaceae bacterium]
MTNSPLREADQVAQIASEISTPYDSGTTAAFPLDRSVVLQKSGLVFSRPLPHRTWELVGRQLLTFTDSSTWWIADWLVYGEAAFEGRYRDAIEKTSLDYQTLRNYAWVARRFELSRRHDGLSFGHHAEVAALDQPEQDFWLRKAEEFGWSRNQLRKEVRASLRERKHQVIRAPRAEAVRRELGTAGCTMDTAMSTTATQPLCLQLTPEQLAQCATLAKSQNMAVEEWAVRVLDAAVRSTTPP